jgi:hypothetical protein
VTGMVSYNDLAARMQAATGVSASRQAYWERTDEACVRFFQSILQRVMLSKCCPEEIEHLRKRGRFRRILLQDSTVIRLPLRLFRAFSGVKNAHKAVCNARIQGTYELLSGRFLYFSIDPYSRNDQAASLDIDVQAGDLVLRDRGYVNVSAIEQHKRQGADSIYRHRHDVILYDPNTGQRIDLLALLTLNGSVDQQVRVGTDSQTSVRLLAAPVCEETANLRRMRAKREAKGHAPSREYLQLMSWTLFWTTITDPDISFQEILELYRLRWRIENIFKTWKSYFHFEKIHNVSQIQLRVLLQARLIMITLSYEKLFTPIARRLYRKTGKRLSLMKFTRYVTQNLPILIRLLNAHRPCSTLTEALLRYCTYEKRERYTFIDQTESILLKTGRRCG